MLISSLHSTKTNHLNLNKQINKIIKHNPTFSPNKTIKLKNIAEENIKNTQ
jgi:hypothetical protein